MNNLNPTLPANHQDAGNVEQDHEDLCPACHDGILQYEYFWKNGVKGEITRDLICDSCEHRVILKIEEIPQFRGTMEALINLTIIR